MIRHRRKHRPQRRRLFWRVYLHGVLLIVTVGLAVALAAHLKGKDSEWHDRPERLVQFVANELRADINDPERLQQRLDYFHDSLDVSLALYHPDRGAAGSTGANPPPPLPPEQLRNIGKSRWERDGPCWSMAVPLDDTEDHYLVARWCSSRTASGFFSLLALILVALAVASIPLARAIARPLEKLTQTAKTLGAGDLSARTGMNRKDEVGALARAIDDMASHLEHRIRSERELLANISHEIRTPLARIRVALEICEEEEGGVEALKAHLGDIAGDVNDLDRLVEQVLVIVRLDLAAAGDQEAQFRLHKEPTDLRDLVEDASRRFNADHPDNTLQVDVDPSLPPVNVDRALMRRVLDNLLDNAAKYTDPGRSISLAVLAENNGVRIRVADPGIGVAEGDLERIFEPFYRTDRSRARDIGGVGLGLALCRRIVGAHGGEIVAKANDPKGLTVEFIVPVENG